MRFLSKGASFLLILLLVVFSSGKMFVSDVYAADLLNKSDTLTSQKISTASNHTIVFRTPTGANESTDTITVTFPSGFNMNSLDRIDVDLAHSAGGQSTCTGVSFTNEEPTGSSPSAAGWGAELSGQVITFTAPTDGVGTDAIAANACVQIQIGTNATSAGTGDTQITNHGTAGSYTVAIGGTFGDSGDIVINILNDDQVSVSAVVDESLTFTISDNSIGFGTLSSTAARYATGDTIGSSSETEAHNLVVGTNASNGYTLTLNGATLTSGANTITSIGASNTASSTGTEQFGLRMTATGGSGTVSVPYAASGFAFDSAAFPDQVASSSTSSSNTTYSVRYLANIGASTEAGNYTSTLTYVAVANF